MSTPREAFALSTSAERRQTPDALRVMRAGFKRSRRKRLQRPPRRTWTASRASIREPRWTV